MNVHIVAMGMGGRDSLTVGALRAIRQSDFLLGARRLLDACDGIPCDRRLEAVGPTVIREALESCGPDVRTASVLVSGDVGFYSLAPRLREELAAFDVQVHAGVSSLAYFCALVGVPWQDVRVVSAHGRMPNAVGAVQSSALTFLLTGGRVRVHDVCRELAARGWGDVQVHAGENLSYPDERVVSGTAEQLAQESFGDLAVMLVRNPRPLSRSLGAPALPDDAFMRGSVPMTKQDVRALAIARLRLESQHVVWDVGAGTGSVSVEAARAVFEGRVVAVERNAEAMDLIRQNRERLGAWNLEVVLGEAPEALEGLPTPDAVFVGGSAGRLEAILRCALAANPRVRVTVAAISLETLAEAVRCASELGLADVDVTQVSVAKAKSAGAHRLMMAQNPVYLISATGAGSEQAASCAAGVARATCATAGAAIGAATGAAGTADVAGAAIAASESGGEDVSRETSSLDEPSEREVASGEGVHE